MMKTLPAIPRNRTPANVDTGELYSIIQLARAFDDPAHVIRYYCRIGLLLPQRRSANRSLKHRHLSTPHSLMVFQTEHRHEPP